MVMDVELQRRWTVLKEMEATMPGLFQPALMSLLAGLINKVAELEERLAKVAPATISNFERKGPIFGE